MDLKSSSKYPSSHGVTPPNISCSNKNSKVFGDLQEHGVKKEKPFLAGSLNLKETSNKRNAPPTPGRPLFSFSNVSRKNSKWNDAEKWLISDLHTKKSSYGFVIKQHHHTKLKPAAEEKVQKAVSIHHNSPRPFNGISDSLDVLKDKFTNEVQPNFECSEPLSESRDPSMVKSRDPFMVKSRDIGTEMTPLGSSTTSRCSTPFKNFSPPRHNTPATRSGPDPGHLLAKLRLETCVIPNWTSTEEEEEDISKSLRHFEMTNECPKSISEPTASAWEEEDKTKCCLRYQREAAKIQAWVDLQNAKAEAQSRKLEVKIQKMRSNFEGKVMQKMAVVHRKAEELRAAAQLQHSEQIQKATEQAKKTMNQHLSMHFSGHSSSCGCFPCNNLHSS
ncbi:uncharacterized protein LOC112511774 [Cynara cardunculus var. scolymus]|uniref:Remorin, C-terminal n=1 Tax=Cynara cardunculus var. scolymus TaxID=59895 RepID=A0A118JXX5_CYNCS|nr:uncharacterized protein LOC112511774 [Cynara cardunculus var. scolymus]KVH97897.1 Remorin, C-terminal [Cynara cardunculus var. scolymus]